MTSQETPSASGAAAAVADWVIAAADEEGCERFAVAGVLLGRASPSGSPPAIPSGSEHTATEPAEEGRH